MHNRLEEYLAEVAAHLSALPTKQRNEELSEMQSHLLNAVEAYQELGETEQEAVESTLSQFGPPKLISHGLLATWRRRQGSWLDRAKIGLLSAAALWGILIFCTFLGNFIGERSNALTAWLSLHFEPPYYALLFGLSALAGALLRGRIARRVAGGTIWGTGLGYVGPMVVYAVIYTWKDSDVLVVSLIALAQAACLTGAAWAGRRPPERTAIKGY